MHHFISDIVFADVQDKRNLDPPAPADEQLLKEFKGGDLILDCSSSPASTSVFKRAEDFF